MGSEADEPYEVASTMATSWSEAPELQPLSGVTGIGALQRYVELRDAIRKADAEKKRLAHLIEQAEQETRAKKLHNDLLSRKVAILKLRVLCDKQPLEDHAAVKASIADMRQQALDENAGHMQHSKEKSAVLFDKQKEVDFYEYETGVMLERRKDAINDAANATLLTLNNEIRNYQNRTELLQEQKERAALQAKKLELKRREHDAKIREKKQQEMKARNQKTHAFEAYEEFYNMRDFGKLSPTLPRLSPKYQMHPTPRPPPSSILKNKKVTFADSPASKGSHHTKEQRASEKSIRVLNDPICIGLASATIDAYHNFSEAKPQKAKPKRRKLGPNHDHPYLAFLDANE